MRASLILLFGKTKAFFGKDTAAVSDGEDGNGLKLEKKIFFKLSSSVSKNSPKLYCSLLFLLNFFDLLPSFVDREHFVCK